MKLLNIIVCVDGFTADFNPRRRVQGNRVTYTGVLSAEDNAVLQCVAANDHGSILANAALKVIGLNIFIHQKMIETNNTKVKLNSKSWLTRQHSYRKEDRAMRPIYGCT